MAVANERWLDAQYSVLGAVLIEPSVTAQVMAETSEGDYYGTCLTVYRAIRKLFLAGTEIDPVSVAGALGTDYQDFLVQLMQITPTAANVESYITICREQSRVSRIRQLAQTMAEEDKPDKIRKLLDDINGVAVDKPRYEITTMSEALKSFMDRHTQPVRYLTWPVPQLNDRLYVELGDFVVIGGRPSAGKSAWALQCAWHWAKNYKVGFFSLETSAKKLFDRQMSAVAQISMDEIKRNTITDYGWDSVCAKTTEITARNLELIQAAGMTPADVRAVTMMRQYQIIFVDYLQLLQSAGENRAAQVTAISIALHTMAQSLGVTVVALSQLARQERGRNDPPDLSSLRESGQIEQDADVVMMLSLHHKDEPEGQRELRIRKNKEGTCPNILLDFDGARQTFYKADLVASAVRDMEKYKEPPKGAKKKKPDPVPPAGGNLEQLPLLPGDTPVPF